MVIPPSHRFQVCLKFKKKIDHDDIKGESIVSIRYRA